MQRLKMHGIVQVAQLLTYRKAGIACDGQLLADQLQCVLLLLLRDHAP